MKTHNFSAGPAILPAEVIKQTAESVANFNGSGLSLMEMSHRGPEIVDIMKNAVSLAKELLSIPEGYEVLFLTGGASTQFFMTAINLLDKNKKYGLVDTGTWSTKAYKEIVHFGPCEILATSKDKNYSYIPKGYNIPADLNYLHLTSNNTICGTQIHSWPETDVPFICDMSSDIFSRPIDVSKYALIYAGAQKNMGPAGTTMVIVKKNILGKVEREIPTMLDYQTHVKKESAFNTPPVLPIYVCMLTLEWVKKMGGLTAMQKRNEEKANLLYAEIDRNSLFKGTTELEDRSHMNVTFVMHDDTHNDAFLKLCTDRNCSGLKGHRSVGGFRASIYNAMDIESIQVLVDAMKDFETQNA
jgi:phosphoserine aminotransferase